MIPHHRLVLPDTPVGPLGLIASEKGLRRIDFTSNPDRVRTRGTCDGDADPGNGNDAPASPADRDHTVLGAAARALEAYFGGAPEPFQGLPLDLQGRTPFQLEVLRALQRIPLGSVRTYGDLARELERGSPRAVGQAVGANPLPIVIPCHRVVAHDRRLGGFSGGLERKALLLRWEGIQVQGRTFHSRIHVAPDVGPGYPGGGVSAPAPG